MNAQTKRTPGPWTHKGPRIEFQGKPGFSGGFYRVADAYSPSVRLANTPSFKEAVANAAFIVQACNAHDDLVAALRDTLARFNALRKAIHESSTHATAENIQSRFNLHLGRDGIETGTQPALEFARAALAKAGAL